MKDKKLYSLIIFLLVSIISYTFYYFEDDINKAIANITMVNHELKDIDDYSGKDYIFINKNNPNFNENDLTTSSFEKYNNLDFLGRATLAYANISTDTMPNKKRESIGMIKPTGWHTIKYDNIEGKFLYNRCHLIGYQLTGENANKNNLITCTRHMNSKTMLEFENEVAEYVKKTNNHVLYRVTPIYKDNNLLATGVQLEALSVEDNGKGIKFNVFIYNIQDGIDIDYKTGYSKLSNK